MDEETHVRLCEGLRTLMGRRKYCHPSDLTKEVLMQYLKLKGDIVEVELFEVQVRSMGGSEFSVTIDGTDNKTQDLKRAIQDQEGTAVMSQQLFLLSKSGEKEDASETPLKNEEVIHGPCSVALLVNDHGASQM